MERVLGRTDVWLWQTFRMLDPGGSVGKESACSVGDQGSILGLGRSPGAGHGNPHQYSCLENSMDRGAWRATVHGVAKSRTQQLNHHWTLEPRALMPTQLLSLDYFISPEL